MALSDWRRLLAADIENKPSWNRNNSNIYIHPCTNLHWTALGPAYYYNRTSKLIWKFDSSIFSSANEGARDVHGDSHKNVNRSIRHRVPRLFHERLIYFRLSVSLLPVTKSLSIDRYWKILHIFMYTVERVYMMPGNIGREGKNLASRRRILL